MMFIRNCLIPEWCLLYGASIWGVRSYSCINAVHHRAMGFFFGTGKYTPNAAVRGDMGWRPILVEQWKSICNNKYSCLTYNVTRINKKIFIWALNKGNCRCKNWPFNVVENLRKLELDKYIQMPFVCKQCLIDVANKVMDMHLDKWNSDLQRTSVISGILSKVRGEC